MRQNDGSCSVVVCISSTPLKPIGRFTSSRPVVRRTPTTKVKLSLLLDVCPHIHSHIQPPPLPPNFYLSRPQPTDTATIMFASAIEMQNHGIHLLQMGQFEDAIGTFTLALDLAKKTAAAAVANTGSVGTPDCTSSSSSSSSSSPISSSCDAQPSHSQDSSNVDMNTEDATPAEEERGHYSQCPLFRSGGPLSYASPSSANPLFLATPTTSASQREDVEFYVFCQPLTVPTDCQSSFYQLSLFMNFNLAQAFHFSAMHRGLEVDCSNAATTVAAADRVRSDLQCSRYIYNMMQRSYTDFLGGWSTFVNLAVRNNLLHVHHLLGDDAPARRDCHHNLLSMVMQCLTDNHHTWEKELLRNELRGFVLNVWGELENRVVTAPVA